MTPVAVTHMSAQMKGNSLPCFSLSCFCQANRKLLAAVRDKVRKNILNSYQKQR
jgi:hypothetical protein